ncbi:PREDICTED: uncharacterized protein LINC00452 [Mandrillus leucophaeus]|uniref:uncharacterized protein LINC00452 n=1 Tax=Mandrillus leucophaeus TaxID=9568 RepID=UPI0005F55DD4|nr:PREDICTED: uncharacterized protein LINC00452 [Mandrillus leucophaeus]
MATSRGLDASADCSLHASTCTPTLQDRVTDRNSYSDGTPEVNTTLAASRPLTGQVHVESGNFTAEPTKVLVALRRGSGSSGRKSFQAAREHSQKQLRILLLLCPAGIRPQAGGHVPGWQDLSTVKLDTPSVDVEFNLADTYMAAGWFCQIASKAALFAVAAECRAGHSSGQSGARLPCISWAMCADPCPLHCSCVPCTYDCVFPVYSTLLHVFQFCFVVCD